MSDYALSTDLVHLIALLANAGSINVRCYSTSGSMNLHCSIGFVFIVELCTTTQGALLNSQEFQCVKQGQAAEPVPIKMIQDVMSDPTDHKTSLRDLSRRPFCSVLRSYC